MRCTYTHTSHVYTHVPIIIPAPSTHTQSTALPIAMQPKRSSSRLRNLDSLARQRHEFEQQKRQLQLEMSKSKHNLAELRRSLRFSDVPHESKTDPSPPSTSGRVRQSASGTALNARASPIVMGAETYAPLPAFSPRQLIAELTVEPSGVYERLRPLGRGSFGAIACWSVHALQFY
jgi:hypothetical protein